MNRGGGSSSAVAGYQAYNLTGTPTSFVNTTQGIIATLIVPATCTVPLTIGGFATVTADLDITNLVLQIVETSNGVDPLLACKRITPTLANGTTASIALPDGAIYVPVTGRVRTLVLGVFATVGNGHTLNEPMATGPTSGYASGIIAKPAGVSS